MENDDKVKAWEETQLKWDDTELLESSATEMMKKKWKRLNKTVISILAKEVVARNEYLSLLDIGAGRGDFYKLSRDIVKKYTGIEPSENMLHDEIKEEDFELRHGTGETLEESCAYDACLIKEVLDHTYEPGKVIKNAYNALKEGGIIIVTLTNKDAFYKLMFKKHAKKLEIEHKDHLFNFNPKEVKDLMYKAGFEVEKTISTNYLRMPKGLENIIGKLPEKFIFWKLDAIDAIMTKLLPEKGGGFIVVGRKKGIESCE